MKILFATNHFWHYTGSELNLIGMARAMAERGHEVACVAQVVSPLMRSGLQSIGLRLLEAQGEAVAKFAPDVAFCQHHSSAALVRSRLPAVPMVLAHLGVEPELEQAPLLDCGVGLHLAISEEVRGQLLSQGIPDGSIRIFRNAIDTSLLQGGSDAAGRQDVLLFSYKLRPEGTSLLASVVQEFGMNLDAAALTTHGVALPADIAARLGRARLVFASGRSALEAAMSGAAVIILGPKGLDGPLTAHTWRDLALCNFSGRRHGHALAAEPLRKAVAEALQSDVAATRDELQAAFGLRQRAEDLERLLTQVPAAAMDEEARARIRRLSLLLYEQRLLAMQQKDAERDFERQQLREQEAAKPLWRRLIRRLLGRYPPG